MERNEILERNKAGKPKDEGLEYIEDKSKHYGEIGFMVIFGLLIF